MSRKKRGSGKRRKALGHDEPFRTCVACRATRPAEEMLRFARAPDGAVGFDVRARLEGRGAWTCASPTCVERALDKGGFERAFEAPVIAKDLAKDLAASVRATLEGEALAGLGLLRRAGHLAAGREDVARAVAAGTVAALVLARDLSARSAEEVRARAGELSSVPGPAQEAIGQAIGRKPTGVLALLGGPASDRCFQDLRRLQLFASSSLAEGPRGA